MNPIKDSGGTFELNHSPQKWKFYMVPSVIWDGHKDSLLQEDKQQKHLKNNSKGLLKSCHEAFII